MSCNISNPNKDFSMAMENYNRAYEAYQQNPTPTYKNNLYAAHNQLTNVLNCYIKNLNTKTIYNEETYAEIISLYDVIRTERADLDMKLREIYDLQDTMPRENRQMFDSTILSVTLCAILASSIVYYIFSE
jgi:hypothetical protein